MHSDHIILYRFTKEFSTELCLTGAKGGAKRIITEVKQSSKDTVLKAINSTTTYSNKKWLEMKESTTQVCGSTSASTNVLWESTQSWVVKQ